MNAPPDVFGGKVLIVDDQESNLRLLDFALRRAGYRSITKASDPLSVLELHRQNRYDLILLDLQMPRMNGFEVMTQLFRDGERVPILVLSADPAQMVRVMEAGARDFISKPFVLAEVLAHVQALLEPVMTGRDVEPARSVFWNVPAIS